MKIRLFILLFTVPVLIFGNNAVVLIENYNEVFEMSCCTEDDGALNDCCCEHSEQEKAPCHDGECTSNGCFFSIQYNLISDIESEFTFLNLEFLDKDISSVFNSFLPIVDQSIWIPPKIYS